MRSLSLLVQPQGMAVIHHLAMRTRELERLVAFYESWFGLRVVREARPRSVWLELGPGAVLMLEAAELDEPGVPEGSRELVALAVSVGEREQLREKLVAAGRLEGETQHTLYFRDPDGRRVGASSYPLAR